MNLLISRHDKIGDFVVTLPLFKAIKEQHPNVKLTALVSKINYTFAKELEFIDDVILYDKDNLIRTLKEIRAKKFDASISGFIDNRLGLLLFLSGIKKRVAPSTKIAQIFFNKRVVQRRSRVEKTEWAYNLDLAKALFSNFKNSYTIPLIKTKLIRENRVVFHAGFGGSSDGNLKFDDYLRLGRVASNYVEVVFAFGPDDKDTKKYMEQNIDFKAILKDDFVSLYEYMLYISQSKLFISTSTGPMHLAGISDTPTISFFGDNLFASPARWATISQKEKQHNFIVSKNYVEDFYKEVEIRLVNILNNSMGL